MQIAGTKLMRDGNLEVGSNTKPTAPGARICGAMAEQRRADGSSENESTPQQFVHLIGCRDPKALRRQLERSRSTIQKA